MKTARQQVTEPMDSQAGESVITTDHHFPDTPTLQRPDTSSPQQRSVSSLSTPWQIRRRVIWHVAGQELRDIVFGWSIYVTAAVALLVGVLLIYNATRSVAESGLEIVSRPFFFPVLVAVSLAALYLAGWAALSIARPRDQGALRVLFFAPVDAIGLLGAHTLAAIAAYALFALVTTPLLLVLGMLTNLPFPPSLLLGIVVSPTFVLPAVAIGLFLSAIAPTARGAIFLFGAGLALLLIVQAGSGALLQIPPTSRYYDALQFLREVFRILGELLQWVSPLALVSEGLDAALRADWTGALRPALAGVAGGAAWLTLAVWALQRRGVLP